MAGGAAVTQVELVCVSLATNVSHAQAAASCRGRGMALWAGRGTNTEQVATTTTLWSFLNDNDTFGKQLAFRVYLSTLTLDTGSPDKPVVVTF